MRCCALIAALFGQLILAYHAMKRALFGETERNASVEWRLDAQPAPALAVDSRPRWLRSRRALGGLALAAALELLLVFGGVYAIVEHFGHGSEHAAHVHQEVQP